MTQTKTVGQQCKYPNCSYPCPDLLDCRDADRCQMLEMEIKALEEKLAEARSQLEQEPVAWMFQHDETGRMNYVSNDGIHTPTMFLGMNPRYALVCPLYTTPPQREWVDLTEKEVDDIAFNSGDESSAILVALDKFKEKNT